MNRRLLLVSLVALAVGGGFAGSALAASPDGTRHKICVNVDPTQPSGDGLCVNWVGPIQPE